MIITNNYVFFIVILLAYSLAKRFHRAKKLSLDSKISLEELNKQHGIDESKILIAIENQKKNIGMNEVFIFNNNIKYIY